MNFSEDEAIIAENFDQNQGQRPIAVSTKSKAQGANGQQQVDKVQQADKVQQPTDETQQQVDKGKQQQVATTSSRPRP